MARYNLERRLTKIEATTSPKGRVIVILIGEGETDEEAMVQAGVQPNPGDLVILLRQFGPQYDEGRCAVLDMDRTPIVYSI
jgi:hypothetical protein